MPIMMHCLSNESESHAHQKKILEIKRCVFSSSFALPVSKSKGRRRTAFLCAFPAFFLSRDFGHPTKRCSGDEARSSPQCLRVTEVNGGK